MMHDAVAHGTMSNHNHNHVPYAQAQGDNTMTEAQQMVDNNHNAQPQCNAIEPMADTINTLFGSVLAQMVNSLTENYDNEVEELDRRADILSKQYARIEKNKQEVLSRLPAEARITQYEADVLLLSGKPDCKKDCEAKLAELEKQKQYPARMDQELADIQTRLEAIASEKSDIARTVFEDWIKGVQPIIRAAERGLFCVLLEGLETCCYQYMDKTDTGAASRPYRSPLVHPSKLSVLTADERSLEFRASQKWYCGRRQ